ncbi:ABC transporter ATP-binding protein [Leptospira borgpetersenii]|uniref:ABC transporter ATP-binding protein n=2 Tax=Leptospira borgpetersenii TaxID=174 RepID=UPI000773F93D|nr:ABC transporter ATP-binding protein [Leptospira borgpetersenii]MBE8398663.1 ABC transporter ATP-binding protein [Leptospira borgpetersenii serovar Tarassovi]MBE8401729.1 ABC transporter ATP-binding protein [Leptospira borgpetersenii serovar Tarassovi]MBE8405167.1 ABC transporter ATP-binding protein [Leptospira borgpetersenii serovar Tarassovi]MBE8414312.1 ABC transporter ATP-binding protein [Leptospira borgpetersenii serovar Tarassovi]MBE8425552.1 ABC transporter ATP-binding protein [Leptos
MNKSPSMFNLLNSLWTHFSVRRRNQLSLLVLLIIIASFTEAFSIGAVLPFLSALTMPEKIFEIEYLKPIFFVLKISKPDELVFPTTVLFIFASIISGGMRLLLLWVSNRLSFAIGTDLSIHIYQKTLYQPYRIHLERNSSEVVVGILVKAKRMIGSIVLPIIQIISSIFIIFSVLGFLIQLDPILLVTIMFTFGSFYSIIALFVRKQLTKNSYTETKENSYVLKLLQDGLGGIRDILLNGNQNFYTEIFKESDQKLRRASAISSFTAASPKFVVETMSMILFAILAYAISIKNGSLQTSLPLLGALALGAQKLLPVLQQTYQSWALIKGAKGTLEDVVNLLNQPLPEYAFLPSPDPMKFENELNLKNISFRYHHDGPWILKNIDLVIKKGSRIGIIGQTGSGKSTLLDLIMGLLEPSSGTFLIDRERIEENNIRAWQMNIANVPQSIFLSDNTIVENIALGVPLDKIDIKKVNQAAKNAKISDYIESLKDGYYTLVGERGVRLSGGQRQRIGIARALYKDASVIVFDEATSALDNETEKAVMDSIDALGRDLTILIIAHRLSTVKGCDQIIVLNAGKIERVGKYQELFSEVRGI